MKSLVAGQPLSYCSFLLCSIDSFWLFDSILILVLFYSTYALYVLHICPSSSRIPSYHPTSILVYPPHRIPLTSSSEAQQWCRGSQRSIQANRPAGF